MAVWRVLVLLGPLLLERLKASVLLVLVTSVLQLLVVLLLEVLQE